MDDDIEDDRVANDKKWKPTSTIFYLGSIYFLIVVIVMKTTSKLQCHIKSEI